MAEHSVAERQMEDDLLELARICLEQARIAQAPNVAAKLRRMAKDYQRRAALAHGGRRREGAQCRRGQSVVAP